MDTPATTSSPVAPPAPRRRRRRVVVLLLLLGTIAALGWWYWRGGPQPDTPPHPPEDPRLTFNTRFLNVRPKVQYVGDAACAGCHEGRSKSYHQHSMGRSLAAATDPRALEHLGKDGRATFAALDRTYVVERRGDRLVHREIASGAAGETIAAREAEVQFVIGSGTRGLGFFIAEDGYLFQSPISWYPQKGAWDLSPGYRQKNEHFDRPISAECLFCHSNRVEPVTQTINRYRTPIFRGETIGCERCHGPGELHVQRQRENPSEPGEEDAAIVNPRRLEPALREAVCEQCHLQGQERVLRRGRDVFDYRPGLPLYLFWSVFEVPPGVLPDNKAVGQVEQMHASRCYQASEGQLGCSSCHDAHGLPSKDDKASYYRRRCLECHQKKVKDCSLSQEARLAKGDHCAACHMPRLSATDIVHVAASDHRILRDPAHEPPAEQAGPPEMPLVHFHRDRLAPEDRNVWIKRDLGVAMMKMAAQAPPGDGRSTFAELALPLLEDATAADPDDLPAWEGLAYAQRFDGRAATALMTYETILARAPERELTLVEAAAVAGRLGGTDRAIGYWRRAIALSPRRWHYHYQLAVLLHQQGQPAQALDECETALGLNPMDVPLRSVQLACLIDLRRLGPARAAFEKLLALKPPNEAELRRWFESRVP